MNFSESSPSFPSFGVSPAIPLPSTRKKFRLREKPNEGPSVRRLPFPTRNPPLDPPFPLNTGRKRHYNDLNYNQEPIYDQYIAPKRHLIHRRDHTWNIPNDSQPNVAPTDQIMAYIKPREGNKFPIQLHTVIEASHKLQLWIEYDEHNVDWHSYEALQETTEAYYYNFCEYGLKEQVPIPFEMQKIFNEEKLQLGKNLHGKFGIFPEINLVYMTLNSTIYFWDYKNGNQDFLIYDDLSDNEIIVQLALVQPLKYFLEMNSLKSVPFCLVVAAQSYIYVYGILEDIKLSILKSHFCKFPIDDCEVKIIRGTNEGRIFFGGTSGQIMEICYHESTTLFGTSRRVKKQEHYDSLWNQIAPKFFSSTPNPIKDIKIDQTRHILYSLSQQRKKKGTAIISVYDLGSYSTEFKMIQQISHQEILSICLREKYKEKNMNLTEMYIAGIYPIEMSQSRDAHLTILMRNGIRITVGFNYYFKKPEEERISDRDLLLNENIYNPIRFTKGHLSIISIKLPPKNISKPKLEKNKMSLTNKFSDKISSGLNTIMNVTKFSYNSVDGSLLIGERKSEVDCILIGLSPSSSERTSSMAKNLELNYQTHGFQKTEFLESLTCFDFPECQVVAIAHVPLQKLLKYEVQTLLHVRKRQGFDQRHFIYYADSNDSLSPICMHELYHQIFMPPQKIKFLTSNKLSTFLKLRPIDILFHILYSNCNAAAQDLSNFVAKYTPLETCGMLLSMICNPKQKFYLNKWFYDHYRNSEIEEKSEKQRNTGVERLRDYRYTNRFEEDEEDEEEDFWQSEYSSNVLPKLAEQAPQVVCNMFFNFLHKIERAKFLFYVLGNSIRPHSFRKNSEYLENQNFMLGHAKKSHDYVFSTKHDSIFLYIGRLLRPLLGIQITYAPFSLEQNWRTQLEMYSHQERGLIKKRIKQLNTFIKEAEKSIFNQQFGEKFVEVLLSNNFDAQNLSQHLIDFAHHFQINGNNPYSENYNQNEFSKMINEEQHSLDSLQQLSERVFQAFYFLKYVLNDNNLTKILEHLSSEEQEELNSITFRNLITNTSCSPLIKKTIQICLRLGIERNLSDFLEQKCYSFFSQEDNNICKAENLFLMATLADSNETKNSRIMEGLSFLKDSAKSVDLNVAIPLMLQTKNLEIVVEICLKKAQQLHGDDLKEINKQKDPKALAHLGYENEIDECYVWIISLLYAIHHSLLKDQNSPFLPSLFIEKKDRGKYEMFFSTLQDYTPPQKEELKKRVITQILCFDDSIMHNSLFKTLVILNDTDTLLNLDSTYLESFLKEHFYKSPSRLYPFYCEKNKQHRQAFNLFKELATMDQTKQIQINEDINSLDKKIECLDLAFHNLQACLINFENDAPNIPHELKKEKENLSMLKQLANVQSHILLSINSILNDNQNSPQLYHQAQKDSVLLNRKLLIFEDLLGLTKQYELPEYSLELYFISYQETMGSNMTEMRKDIENSYESVINSIWNIYSPSGEWPLAITAKLRELGIKYCSPFISNDSSKLFNAKMDIFPLRTIINTIEKYNFYYFGLKEANFFIYKDKRFEVDIEKNRQSPTFLIDLLVNEKVFQEKFEDLFTKYLGYLRCISTIQKKNKNEYFKRYFKYLILLIILKWECQLEDTAHQNINSFQFKNNLNERKTFISAKAAFIAQETRILAFFKKLKKQSTIAKSQKTIAELIQQILQQTEEKFYSLQKLLKDPIFENSSPARSSHAETTFFTASSKLGNLRAGSQFRGREKFRNKMDTKNENLSHSIGPQTSEMISGKSQLHSSFMLPNQNKIDARQAFKQFAETLHERRCKSEKKKRTNLEISKNEDFNELNGQTGENAENIPQVQNSSKTKRNTLYNKKEEEKELPNKY